MDGWSSYQDKRKLEMIKQVVAVLKKHLDEAYEELEQWEAIEISPFDVLQEHPDQYQLRRLAYELIGVIKGTDVAKLIQLPKYRETFDFLKTIYPTSGLESIDEELVAHQTRSLRIWLAGFRRWREKGLIIRS